MEAVLAEINGWHTDHVAAVADRGPHGGVLFPQDRQGQPHHGPQVADYNELKADGSTACGCWIYSGVFNRDGINKANARQSKDYLGHGWGFSWPSDRRIIYNRASASPTGEPWSDRKKLIWWDQAQSKWTGGDVPDFPVAKSPNYRPTRQEKGLDAIPGDAPFMLHEDGLGWLYVPKGLQDGPFRRTTSRSNHRCAISFIRAIPIRRSIGLPGRRTVLLRPATRDFHMFSQLIG